MFKVECGNKQTRSHYSWRLSFIVELLAILLIMTSPCVHAAVNQAPSIIKGKVAGSDNLPLQGVSVIITGTTTGTFTDRNGLYILEVDGNAQTIEFSFVGYAMVRVPVNERREINIALISNTATLEDVTVTGYTSYNRSRSASSSTTVSSEKISQVPLTVDQILQGRVPGLVVAAGSGQPGQNARLTLRGVGTITGNTSILYVMDGVPIETGFFQSINPSDIESITVLKDASAKALYGSRGSNGVIVITSKKGRAGRVSFDYKSQYGFSNMSSPKFKMMNAAEHLLFEEEIGLETGATAGPGWTYSKKNPAYALKIPAEKQRADFIIDSLTNLNTDWRKLFFRTGKFIEQQVNASGGNENIRFYSSLNYYKQDGIAVRSTLQRFTLRNNLDFTVKKFSANVNLSLGYSSSSFIESEGASSGNNPLSAVYYALPYEYPYFPNDTLVHSGNTSRFPVFDLREGSNAYERMLNTSNKSNQLKTILSTSASYTIAGGLVAKTRMGIDFRESLDEAFINPNSYSGSRVSNGRRGSLNEGTRRNFSIISTSGLTYAKTFAELHDVEVSTLFEYNFTGYRAFSYTGYGIEGRLPRTPAGITAGSATNSFIPVIGGSRTKSALASYMAFGRYTFEDKYTLNASYRYDGSSTVPENNRWHGFYSVGLNWEAKKENFFDDVSFISGLRFRTSYGKTASPFSRDFGYIGTYANTSYGGNAGIRPLAPGNPDYDWEYATEFNAGFDLSLLSTSRIRLIMDVYQKTTDNLFFNRPLSITSGFGSSIINGGSVRNKGFEIDLQGDVIKNKSFTWTVGGNYSYNKNEVTDLAGADAFENGFTGLVRVGLPLGSHYAPKWAGVDPATGNPLYYAKDGATTTTYNAATLSVAEFGSYIPAITGGFNTSLSWKGIYLNALLSFMDKVQRYNNEDYYNENPSFKTSNQSIRMLYNRWKKPGDIALLPKIAAARNYTSRDIYDASFLRLRNVNIGYSIPQQFLSRLKVIRSIQVFAQAENLYTWTKWRGFDPENGNEYARFSYPSPRTYTAGLNVNF
ncbi:MAG: SusC/RagA family TonB-linked outer membrane protein [Chitinophagaceae bacterium]